MPATLDDVRPADVKLDLVPRLDAARRCHCDPRTFDRFLADNRLGYIQIRRRKFVRASTLDRLLSRLEKAAA